MWQNKFVVLLPFGVNVFLCLLFCCLMVSCTSNLLWLNHWSYSHFFWSNSSTVELAVLFLYNHISYTKHLSNCYQQSNLYLSSQKSQKVLSSLGDVILKGFGELYFMIALRLYLCKWHCNCPVIEIFRNHPLCCNNQFDACMSALWAKRLAVPLSFRQKV